MEGCHLLAGGVTDIPPPPFPPPASPDTGDRATPIRRPVLFWAMVLVAFGLLGGAVIRLGLV